MLRSIGLPKLLPALCAMPLLFAAAPSFSAAAVAGKSASPVVIAQSLDLSGPNVDSGKDFLTGAKIYFDHVNATGGINGHPLLHVYRDDGGRPDKALENTREFIGRAHAQVLFGYMGDNVVDALVRNPEFRQSALPLVAPLAGADVAAEGDQAFYVRASYAQEARQIVASFVRLGITRFAVAHSADPYGDAALRSVEEELTHNGLRLASKHVLAPDGRNIDAVVRALYAGNPQAVIVIADTPQTAQLVRGIRTVDHGMFVFGLSLVNATTLTEITGNGAANGTILTQVVPDPNKPTLSVVREFQALLKKYRDEAPSYKALEGFIAAKTLVAALKSSAGDFSAQRIASALRALRRFDAGGYFLDLSKPRASPYVDTSIINKYGVMLH